MNSEKPRRAGLVPVHPHVFDGLEIFETLEAQAPRKTQSSIIFKRPGRYRSAEQAGCFRQTATAELSDATQYR
jgi:hypothetical protein